MDEIRVFENPAFGQIRTAGTSNEPKFCLTDLCKALDLGNPSQVKTRLEDGVISNEGIVDSLGRVQNVVFVNEDGLYDVILDSRKPEAKAFRKWITSEVLPSIRKMGKYSVKSEATKDEPKQTPMEKVECKIKAADWAVKNLHPDDATRRRMARDIMETAGMKDVIPEYEDYGVGKRICTTAEALRIFKVKSTVEEFYKQLEIKHLVWQEPFTGKRGKVYIKYILSPNYEELGFNILDSPQRTNIRWYVNEFKSVLHLAYNTEPLPF